MIFNYYKNKFLINTTAILLFFTLTTAFIIYPSLMEIAKVNQEIINERIKLEKKLALGLNIKKIIQDLENIEGSAKQLDDALLNKGQELDFINNLELLGSKYGLQVIINSDFISQDGGFNVSKIEIQVTATGNYRSILKFIKAIESQKNYFILKSIVFSKNKKAGSSDLTVQLTGDIYFKK
ncbi:MAG: hypothetical protein A3B89_04300 [Candidatus Buchananbacteria bacterium RIFCSPHIGHO2_02_FULL_40_13]|uniref:Type 4 fimbrial biogenesis protein PilO n=1 Tax=Candidatus Buchananbacteria bacterium RIFCSPLOWO2_01_FULL_39_33 TaxID=1797543 RepID=A0A1G1YMC8_9BACT|nr:MAG: hypothetical protein A2820_02005 [Candidatus Buchananbacteria bacterium RIFCSPHIGHO2_01_FULL_40_35]OGY50899.1 MAG: hypothetical protein A3B89_04300 [Candidatus Buchananbacteria bacterium RIFCSPHIGHO2_02_FULL_40_13]OGY52966.1 MAG: hypothetical protein A3A02_04475 [Candidatus Buchananbacteria bacterium RIFCSPLOWO2_01_FULL_39_33]